MEGEARFTLEPGDLDVLGISRLTWNDGEFTGLVFFEQEWRFSFQHPLLQEHQSVVHDDGIVFCDFKGVHIYSRI